MWNPRPVRIGAWFSCSVGVVYVSASLTEGWSAG